ncbi:hypothetical protein QAD02_017234 [Eretmocerus hayati]|uniref:Uncharacterized protein n=1 Tax=Eretmocerus hayati TaxID=131215 RepID=A0ACC2PG78_9HYME|nr:hypothetical protein QAD02_017234 [Eretmocerus hayati]
MPDSSRGTRSSTGDTHVGAPLRKLCSDDGQAEASGPFVPVDGMVPSRRERAASRAAAGPGLARVASGALLPDGLHHEPREPPTRADYLRLRLGRGGLGLRPWQLRD